MLNQRINLQMKNLHLTNWKTDVLLRRRSCALPVSCMRVRVILLGSRFGDGKRNSG